MITDIATITIAVISLLLSIYVIIRDRKIKKLDNLHSCRQNILSQFENNDILTVDEMIDFFEVRPESSKAKKYKAKSEEISSRVDREFEYTCYLVLKKQIEFDSFFDLFKKWLALRCTDWDNRQQHKKTNFLYTWKVIQVCKKKKLLPLKKVAA